jgi:hypothetical protein
MGEGRTIVGRFAEELALARSTDRVDSGRDESRHCTVRLLYGCRCREREKVESQNVVPERLFGNPGS